MANKYVIGALVLVILSTSIYVMLPDQVRIDVEKTRTRFSVYENGSYVLAATEYVNLFDGSAKMRAKKRNVSYELDGTNVVITREANYKDNITTIQTYTFDSTTDDVELTPVSHEVECINCVGKILHFEYKDILYNGPTQDITSPFAFGHNMKLEWEAGAYYAKVKTYKFASPKIWVRYKPIQDYQIFKVRMFDPTPPTIAGFNDSVIAYYNFEQDPGTSQLIDQVGTNDSISHTTIERVNGYNNYGWNYTVGDEVAMNSNILNGTSSFAWFCWVKHYSTGVQRIVYGTNQATLANGIILKEGAGAFNFRHTFTDTEAEGNIDGTSEHHPTLDTWYMLGTNYNGTHVSWWMNDTQMISAARTGNLLMDNLFEIGTNIGGEGAYYTLDECIFYNRSFTTEEIKTYYNNNTGGSFYPFAPLPPPEPANLSFDKINTSRKYEYETTANITAEVSNVITIYDLTNRYVGATSPINYLIDTLRMPIPSITLTGSNSTYNITVDDNRSDIYMANFTIKGNGGVANLSLNYSGNYIHFPGILSGELLQQDLYLFGGETYNKLNISFKTAESKTIFINYSSQGNLSRKGTFNLTIKAFSLDSGNEFNYNERFYDTNTSSSVGYGAVSPIGTVDPFNQSFETFFNNQTQDRWTINGLGGFVVDNTVCYTDLFRGYDSCIRVGDENKQAGSYVYYNEIDLNGIDYFTAEAMYGCACACESQIEFTDLTNNVKIHGVQHSTCPDPGFVQAECNYTFRKNSTNVWTIVGERAPTGGGDCGRGNFDISSLNYPYYLRVRNVGGASGNSRFRATNIFKSFNLGGIYLNKSNNYTTGIEGSLAGEITGNFTTHILNTTANPVIRATLFYNAYTPEGTNITALLSNDGGTTFEETVNASSHLFTSSGQEVMAKFILRTSSNITTPLIKNYQVQVVTTEMDNLTIDIGNDGVADFNFSNTLDSTSTPVYADNDTSVNNYIFETCNATPENCLIPVVFDSGSGGLLEIQVNLTQDINPVRFDIPFIQYLNSINFTQYYDSGTSVTYEDFKFDYRGSKNISVVAGTDNLTIEVVYSKFNLSYPSGTIAWQLFPSTRVQNDTEPYGQTDIIPIWNITPEGYHPFGVDIYVKYNETINTCVANNTFVGYDNNTGGQLNQSVNATAQRLLLNVSNLLPQSVWTYTDINCSDSTIPFIIPYYCFQSICTDCVRTSDWDDTCGAYE